MVEYAYLSEIFPDFFSQNIESRSNLDIIQTDEAPPSYCNDLLLELKPGEKLRIIGDNLIIDKRKFQCFARKYSRDSRWGILKFLLENKTTNKESYLQILRTSTYSKDEKWIEASYSKF